MISSFVAARFKNKIYDFPCVHVLVLLLLVASTNNIWKPLEAYTSILYHVVLVVEWRRVDKKIVTNIPAFTFNKQICMHQMLNEHAYHHSLKREPIQRRTNKPTSYAKFSHALQGDFWAQCCALRSTIFRTVHLFRTPLETTREFLNPVGGFVYQYCKTGVCATGRMSPSTHVWISLFAWKRRWNISNYMMNCRWASKLWVHGKEGSPFAALKWFDIYRWLRQFHVF